MFRIIMHRLFYFSLLLSLFFLSGCREEEEDVYNPKSRLSAIFDYQKSATAPFVKFRYNQNNQIERVVFDQYTYFEMEYNPDNQVSKIVGYFNSDSYGYVLIDYIDKKMSKISYYNYPGTLFQVDTFYRYRGTLYAYQSFIVPANLPAKRLLEHADALYSHVMHRHSISQIESLSPYKSGELQLISQTNLKVKQKNIEEMETVYANGYTILAQFEYDDNPNPLYGLPFVLINYFPFPSSPLTAYSVNNFVTSTFEEHYGTPTGGEKTCYTLDYQKNKYPTHIYVQQDNSKILRWRYQYVDSK